MMFTQVGRMGGVGKEVMEREAIEREGKSELREIEGGGGEFEMVSLKDLHLASGPTAEEARNQDETENDLREEAYTWPRVVAPPMKRAGHVILDTCFPDGTFLYPNPRGYMLRSRKHPEINICQVPFETGLSRCQKISLGRFIPS